MYTPPAFIMKILKSINSLGYDAFLVGGWVRDAYLGISSDDFDICTNAPLEVLEPSFSSYALKLHARQFGALSFEYEGASVEITRFRSESDYTDHRHPNQIEFVDDLMTDLKRRDFTINTLCYHPDTGVIDAFGGQSDLDQRLLRTVGDPSIRFGEDALRIVRLFRLKAEYGFDIEPQTLAAALKHVDLLNDLKISEWKHEFLKLICAPEFLEVALVFPELFGALIPELASATHFDQLNPFHKYSLYEHSMRVSGTLPPQALLRLVGIFHDLGKLVTQFVDASGVGHYRGHAHASVILALPYFKAFQFKKKETQFMLELIEYHDYKLEETLASIHLFAYQHSLSFTRDLIVLKRCDNLAKSDLALYQVARCDVFESLLDQVERLPLKANDLLIGSNDITNLGIDVKHTSQVLNRVLERVIQQEIGNDRIKQMTILEGVVEDDLYQSK